MVGTINTLDIKPFVDFDPCIYLMSGVAIDEVLWSSLVRNECLKCQNILA